MNFNISGENIEVTSAIREYIEKKITKLERYFNLTQEAKVHVKIRFNPDKTSKVEVTISLTYFVLRAEETNIDLYAAVDLILDKLERQIRKYKTKINRKFHKKGGFIHTFVADAKEENKEEQLEIVRMKQFDLKPMDSEEAILQMNLIGHSFYVFNDADTNHTNVIYKRRDGRYGLIDAH
jgi:ribosomal subunit interface protein